MGEQTWHGYPQAEGAHAERPWWRGTGNGYARRDGYEVRARFVPSTVDAYDPESDEWRSLGEGYEGGTNPAHAGLERAIREIDREHPLPAPSPKVGQVWVSTEHAVELAIVGVKRNPVTGLAIHWGDGGSTVEWPPPSAVLVAGPHAPWQGPERG